MEPGRNVRWRGRQCTSGKVKMVPSGDLSSVRCLSQGRTSPLGSAVYRACDHNISLIASIRSSHIALLHLPFFCLSLCSALYHFWKGLDRGQRGLQRATCRPIEVGVGVGQWTVDSGQWTGIDQFVYRRDLNRSRAINE